MAASTSLQYTFSPPRSTMSLARSTMNTNPSSSMGAMSPVLNHPSRLRAGVAPVADRVGGCLRTIEVTLDDDRPAHTQLPDDIGAGGQIVAIVVDQLGVER